ncbi:hypothetical protein [Salmonella enterica]|nr:hypothetical protein [Salmonella enterica]WKN78925.1 hypothetical protein PQC30_04890 [Salmonella enterica subsp. diarizonae]
MPFPEEMAGNFIIIIREINALAKKYKVEREYLNIILRSAIS